MDFKSWNKVSMGTNIAHNSIEMIGFYGWLNPASAEAGGGNSEPITEIGYQLGNGDIVWIDGTTATKDITNENNTTVIQEDKAGLGGVSEYARRFMLWLNVKDLVPNNNICSLYL